ncbi:MAG: phosphotransferase [Chloroflexota bacterium]
MLERHGLDGLPEEDLPNDGWSGSRLTTISRGPERFVLKRTSSALDWIVRATRDIALRESVVAGNGTRLVEPLVAPYLGTGSAGDAVAILMPDLSRDLIRWEEPVAESTLDLVIDAVARLHAMPWADYHATTPDWDWPWCPLRERLLLLSRPAAEGYGAEGLTIGDRFLAGWDAFDRRTSSAARALIETLSDDPNPLLEALGRLPKTGLHGDLKLANVAPLGDGRVALIDWQMMSLAPVAVELGWLLVSNSSSIRATPDDVMRTYHVAAVRAANETLPVGNPWLTGPSVGPAIERHPDRLPPRGLDATIGDWGAQLDLTWIVGLLLRGWRKGLDAEAGDVLPSGVSAADDLAWWSARAVEAADRRL